MHGSQYAPHAACGRLRYFCTVFGHGHPRMQPLCRDYLGLRTFLRTPVYELSVAVVLVGARPHLVHFPAIQRMGGAVKVSSGEGVGRQRVGLGFEGVGFSRSTLQTPPFGELLLGKACSNLRQTEVSQGIVVHLSTSGIHAKQLRVLQI